MNEQQTWITIAITYLSAYFIAMLGLILKIGTLVLTGVVGLLVWGIGTITYLELDDRRNRGEESD